jgi:hypothetical protein
MYVCDLLVDHPHHDRYLILRTFAHVLEVSNMQICVATEDEKGQVEQLIIYQYGSSRWPDDKMSAGMILVVKNPYLRSVITNGGMTLSAFHPSDIVVLDQDHELFPAKWKTAQHNVAPDAAQWKACGNVALKEKNYQKANYPTPWEHDVSLSSTTILASRQHTAWTLYSGDSRDIHRPITYVIFTRQSAEESGVLQNFAGNVDDQAKIRVREGNHRSVTPELLPCSPHSIK